MSGLGNVYDDLGEYIRQREPDARRMGSLWQTAIGLQAVDGLRPSDYLIGTAKRNIDGDITIDEVKRLVHGYYESQAAHREIDRGTEEADKVSTHIAEVLSEDAFVFSPGQLMAIHRRLFEGVYEFAGQVRDYNISKREWVLGGRSVTYASADMIRESLEYDFSREKGSGYAGLSSGEMVERLAAFVANVWQVHPFGEGNTRSMAVFAIKYLRSLGFPAANEPFAQHAWYFRNALVRANYSDIQAGVDEDRSFLVLFFRNLLMGESNELKNRYLHLDYERLFGADAGRTNANVGETGADAGKNVGKTDVDVGKTHEDVGKAKADAGETEPGEDAEMLPDLVLREMAAEPTVSLARIADKLGMSTRHIERVAAALQEEGRVERLGSKRGGRWHVL